MSTSERIGGAPNGERLANVSTVAAHDPLPAVAELDVAGVARREVLRYLGHRGQGIDRVLATRIDATIAQVQTLARPRAAMRGFRIGARATGAGGVAELHLHDSALVLVGTSVATLLAQASEVVVMAVTLGMGVDRELRRLSLAGDALAQLLFDAAATAAVEHAADAAEALVARGAARGDRGTTRRFSPGYGDLPLSCQATLLASVDATRRIGLTLTASDLLVPTKSVTAVMGVGTGVARGEPRACTDCKLRDQCEARADTAPAA